MYLGEEVYVKNSEIIGIFDIERCSTSAVTREYLAALGKRAVTITYEMPKSFVVSRDKTYISQLMIKTLKKRFEDLSI
ncbi:MAG: DUF370 domain-containing protein [Ruminococcus sp.]|jgi:hypothetical protein|nr:DUF370 domain-containing protein [Ruminococcus sp.]